MRNRSIVIVIVALVGISLALPASSYAWRHGYGHGGRHGWYGPGAFVGGLVLGAIITRPWYAPAPVYVYPAPTAVYPPSVYVPNQAYAYPDPDAGPGPDGSGGQWVEVPGQYVNGRWVPSHKVWVADNR